MRTADGSAPVPLQLELYQRLQRARQRMRPVAVAPRPAAPARPVLPAAPMPAPPAPPTPVHEPPSVPPGRLADAICSLALDYGVQLARGDMLTVIAEAGCRLRIADVQRAVAAHYGCTVRDLASPYRAAAILRPRQIAMYLAKQLTSRSLPIIGREFGGRDHSTVLHAVRKMTALEQSDPALAEELSRLRATLAPPKAGEPGATA